MLARENKAVDTVAPVTPVSRGLRPGQRPGRKPLAVLGSAARAVALAPLRRQFRRDLLFCLASGLLGLAGFAVTAGLLLPGLVISGSVLGIAVGLLLVIAATRAARQAGATAAGARVPAARGAGARATGIPARARRAGPA